MTARPKLPPRLRTGDVAQDARALDLERALRAPLSCPLLDGVQVSGVVPDVGATVELAHNLGRVPRGWLVIDAQDAGVDLVRSSWTASRLTLGRGTDAVTDARFAVWVF